MAGLGAALTERRWLQAKFALVIVLSGIAWLAVAAVRDFAADRNRHSQKFYQNHQ